MKGFLQRVFTKSEDKPISYQESRDMAASQDAGRRSALAKRTDVKPEILYYLAGDADPVVRGTIARNQATPVQADIALSKDKDDHVRGDLAAKLAALAPGLTDTETDKLRRMTYDALQTLARDQAVMVRKIIADTLKDMVDAPAPIIRQLARDAEMVVAGPVLRYSPVLNESDLLEIIETSSGKAALSFISKRHKPGYSVSDAIVARGDREAIGHLLANTSAQIREETLNRLIDMAPDIEDWHTPLVQRPKLPGLAASKLARFVADTLLTVLENRRDLDTDQIRAVKDAVRQRIETGELKRDDDGGNEGETILEKARRLHEEGNLAPEDIATSLGANDLKLVRAALAVRSGLTLEAVGKVLGTQSAKGVVSLCWKARLPADMSVKIQVTLGHVPPDQTLNPRGRDYPLSEDDMIWQLEFFTGMAMDAAG